MLKPGDRKDHSRPRRTCGALPRRCLPRAEEARTGAHGEAALELERTGGASNDKATFRKVTGDLKDLTSRIDAVLERTTRSDVQWS